jgi:hypothetical protein
VGHRPGTLAFVVGPNDAAFPDVTQVFDAQLPNTTGVDAARLTGESIELADVDGTPVRILSHLVSVGEQPFVIQVVADRIAEERALAVLLTVLAVGGLLVLAIALGVGWLYAERALIPIRDAMRRQRDFAADASHELRTPLSVVKGSVAHLRRHPDQPVGDVGDALDDIEAETDRLGALVDDLLLLARSDSGALELAVEPTDLGEVTLDAAGSLAPLGDPNTTCASKRTPSRFRTTATRVGSGSWSGSSSTTRSATRHRVRWSVCQRAPTVGSPSSGWRTPVPGSGTMTSRASSTASGGLPANTPAAPVSASRSRPGSPSVMGGDRGDEPPEGGARLQVRLPLG